MDVFALEKWPVESLCGALRGRLRARVTWRAGLLAGVLATGCAAAGAATVLLTFEPFLEARDLVGDPVAFVDSTLVTRLQTLDPAKTRAQIAIDVKAAVDTRLAAMFAGLDARFTNQLVKADAIVSAYSGQLYFDRAATGDKTFGRADVTNKRAIVVVDEFDADKVFIPPPPGDGRIRKLEQANPDTAPHNEVANALSKTIAHEVGHLFGLGHSNRKNMTIEPDPASGIVLGPDDKITTDPGFGIMAQGLMILPPEFSAREKKFLSKALGTTGPAAQAARQRDTALAGDIDTFGSGESGYQRDMALAQSVSLAAVMAGPGEEPGTDTVLSDGLVQLVLAVGPPLGSELDAAFLQLHLLNAGFGAVRQAWLRINGIDVDLTAGFAGLNGDGIATTVLLDLDEFAGAMSLLRDAGALSLWLDFAVDGIAIDYAQLDLFGRQVPEPSTLMLAGLALLAAKRQRAAGRRPSAT